MSLFPLALTPADRAVLVRAHEHLEYPSFAIRLSNVIGTPIEMGLKLLPRSWYRHLHDYAERAISNALESAVHELKGKEGRSSDAYYRMLGILGGAVGGLIGGPALLLELPFTTSVMLRTIADIARSEGENLDHLEARLACIEVFALGGCSRDDDAAETGYYGLRLALEASVGGVARQAAHRRFGSRAGAPMVVEGIRTIARRFGVTLSEKAAAEMLPVVGALGGACINSLFIGHFQDMARHHFAIRRLERKYGARRIRAEYDKLAAARQGLLLAA